MSSRGSRRTSGGAGVPLPNVSTLRTSTRAGSNKVTVSSTQASGSIITGNSTRISVAASLTTSLVPSVTTRGTISRSSIRVSTTRSVIPVNSTRVSTGTNRRVPSVAPRGLPYNIPTTTRSRAETHVPTQGKVNSKPSSRQESPPPYSPNRMNTRSMALRNVVYCPICFSNVRLQDGLKLMATECGHLFCEDCIIRTLLKRPCCPLCLQLVSKSKLRQIFL